MLRRRLKVICCDRRAAIPSSSRGAVGTGLISLISWKLDRSSSDSEDDDACDLSLSLYLLGVVYHHQRVVFEGTEQAVYLDAQCHHRY